MESSFTLTPAAHAIINTLRGADDELSGYALIQATGHASGTVYPLLERLTAAGLLARRRESEDEWIASGAARPLRKYYALTETGREAADTPPADTGPVAIDPPGCGCTECITGEYVPLDRATDRQIAALLRGEIQDNTGLTFETLVVVRDEHGQFSRALDPALLGISLDKER